MILLISILIAYTLCFLIEVYHDNIHRLIRNKGRNLLTMLKKAIPGYDKTADINQDNKWSSDWHSLDWKGHAIIALLVGELLIYPKGYSWELALVLIATTAVMIGTLRMLILNIGINLKIRNDSDTKREWFRLGDSGFEAKFKGKEILFHLGSLLLFLVSFIILWLTI